MSKLFDFEATYCWLKTNEYNKNKKQWKKITMNRFEDIKVKTKKRVTRRARAKTLEKVKHVKVTTYKMNDEIKTLKYNLQTDYYSNDEVLEKSDISQKYSDIVDRTIYYRRDESIDKIIYFRDDNSVKNIKLFDENNDIKENQYFSEIGKLTKTRYY